MIFQVDPWIFPLKRAIPPSHASSETSYAIVQVCVAVRMRPMSAKELREGGEVCVDVIGPKAEAEEIPQSHWGRDGKHGTRMDQGLL